MSEFAGMEDLLQDFLVEAGDLLSDVDNKLVDLERTPDDVGLLNEIFRGFHTIKGGAGFLAATHLVELCHLTENLFDKLRNRELEITPEAMDVILSATGAVREMFDSLAQGAQPAAAEAQLIDNLKQALAGDLGSAAAAVTVDDAPDNVAGDEPDWELLHAAVSGMAPPAAALGVSSDEVIKAAIGRRATDTPGCSGPSGRREGERQRETSIRADTTRLDQVLNLSGEIGLTKNRLNALRSQILNGDIDKDTLHALDVAVSQLDLLVSDLQIAVIKTRMQPIGRLFQRCPRIARDLARNLGKDVELALLGEETEIDTTMIEDLTDPIIHLIRNAIDHGVENNDDRRARGKPEKSILRLEARQEGKHIVIIVADDGHGMNAEKLRASAVSKDLISDEEANTMDDRQSYKLVFLPGVSTVNVVSDVSGRGVGMDVVRTNIQKLNGEIEIKSAPGEGTRFTISLPLMLAILPVLLVRLSNQPLAVPLGMVREILPIDVDKVQDVGGRATMMVRGEVLPIVPLANLLGWPQDQAPEFGVLMHTDEQRFILAVDEFAGREDAVIKSLDDFRPEGVAGVTMLANGQIVLILDMNELLAKRPRECQRVTRSMLFRQRELAA